jgi:hypothetical protein
VSADDLQNVHWPVGLPPVGRPVSVGAEVTVGAGRATETTVGSWERWSGEAGQPGISRISQANSPGLQPRWGWEAGGASAAERLLRDAIQHDCGDEQQAEP